jgi:protein O-GlcNAc transferase
LLDTATENHRTGNLAEARRLYGEVLAVAPHHPPALFRFGVLELQELRLDAALDYISRAAVSDPGNSRYQLGLGEVLQSLERWDEAADAYRRAVAAEAGSFDAHFELGVALQRAGRPALAATAYRGALALKAGDAATLGNLGAALRECGDLDGAVEFLEAAAAGEPLVAAHTVNLAIALCQRREFAQAELKLTPLAAREPAHAEAAFNLGNALRGLGRPAEALAQYRRAVELRSGYAEALNNMGNVLKELGDFAAAMAAYEAAMLARPEYVAAINNAGCLFRTLGRSDEAEDMLRRGLEIDPEHASLYDNLGNVLKDAGALDEAIVCYRRSLEIDPNNPATHGNLAYSLSFASTEARPILEECTRWNARFAAPLVRCEADRARDLSPERKLKVGYISPDFRTHCQALFTVPLLSHHDRAAFEVYCYSSAERPDSLTRRIAGLADGWREVRALDDVQLCRAIRDDGIDILVDLTMHMAGGRPLVFARRPAPVQIAWLAYPGTTGMDAIDYRLSDPRLDPDGYDSHYTEKTLRLDDSFWCYDPLTEVPEVNGLPAAERGYVTLGCLNNPCKLTERTLRLWGRVMHTLPQARLKLMAPPGRHRLRLLARLGAQGVAAERVSFVEFRPRGDYLRSYHEIDFGLDTFPYNGHTTSLDALWMGVPTVTRVGATCVGRAGLSQLYHLDLLDLAAKSDDAFAAAAAELARDLPRLAALRAALRERMTHSPLMDAARFARNIERAYRQAWLAHRNSAGRAAAR